MLLIKSPRGLRAHLSFGGVCSAAFIHTRTIKGDGGAPMPPLAPAPCLPSRAALSSAERSFSHEVHYIPISPLTSQCRSLSAVIWGSFRTASLSFTLGSISASLERISKARGRYIIQAWSPCPGLILTRSQVGHMLQLNSPSPYPHVVFKQSVSVGRVRRNSQTDTAP